MRNEPRFRDAGLLGLRVITGGLLMGHGGQKLFGWFEGHGLEGTGGFLESMGMRPGERFALMAGLSEFASGAFTGLGLFWPAGPLSIIGPMMVATRTAHAGKPVWVTSGGAELPIMYMAVGGALALTRPGRLSLDHLLGLKLPPALVALIAAAVAGGTLFTLSSREEAAPAQGAEAQQEQPTAEQSPASTQGQSTGQQG